MQDRTERFIANVLLPMIESGDLDDLERKALDAAWQVYGMGNLEPSEPARLVIEKVIRENTGKSRDLNKAERRKSAMDVFAMALKFSGGLTSVEFDALTDWLKRDLTFAASPSSRLAPAWLREGVEKARIGTEQRAEAEARAKAETEEKAKAKAAHAPEKVSLVQGAIQDEGGKLSQRIGQSMKMRPGSKEFEGVGLDLSIPGSHLVRKMAFAGAEKNLGQPVVFVDAGEQKKAGDIWFVGDVHGDLVGLEATLHYIDKKSPEATVVFLGDLFDRGRHSFQVITRIMQRIAARPGKVCVLRGNHDESLHFAEKSNRFTATVHPADFAEELNLESEKNAAAHTFGKRVVEFGASLPRAIVFEGGLFAAHGGIPLSDIWPAVKNFNDLATNERGLNDFVWNRVSADRPRKIPNRFSTQSEFGYEDFFKFCEVAGTWGKWPVKWMVRGHDHVDTDNIRYACHPKWLNRVLTINNMCHRIDSDIAYFNPTYVRKPALARYVQGGMPEVHVLDVPEALVAEWDPEPKP